MTDNRSMFLMITLLAKLFGISNSCEKPKLLTVAGDITVIFALRVASLKPLLFLENHCINGSMILLRGSQPRSAHSN